MVETRVGAERAQEDAARSSATDDGDHRDDAAGRERAFRAGRPVGLYGPAVAAKRGLGRRGPITDDPIIPGEPFWVPLGPSVLSNRLSGTGPWTPCAGRVTALRVAPGGKRAYAGTANGSVCSTFLIG